MDPRVVLHVGTPKSGTTFLQRALWRNREEMRDLGVIAAGERNTDAFHAAIEVRESYAFWGRTEEELRGSWRRLCAAAREHDGTTVISHELLGAASQQQASAALAELEGVDLDVVVTARDLARQLASEWQERVKNGNAVTFETFSVNVADRRQSGFWRNQHLTSVLDRWAASLPPERVHVVVGPRPGSPPELLWHRFGEAIGFDASTIDPVGGEPPANQTLGVAQVAVLRRINELLDGRIPQPAYGRVVKRHFAQTVLAGQDARSAQCPPDLVGRLATIAGRQNQRLAESGYQVHGDLDELIPQPPADDGWTDPDRIGAEEEAAAAAAAIAEMLVERAAPRDRGAGASAPPPGVLRRVARRLRAPRDPS